MWQCIQYAVVVIALQCAMHAARYLFTPSVRQILALCLNEGTFCHSFLVCGKGITLVFLSVTDVIKFEWQPPYTGKVTFVIFDRNRRLSLKQTVRRKDNTLFCFPFFCTHLDTHTFVIAVQVAIHQLTHAGSRRLPIDLCPMWQHLYCTKSGSKVGLKAWTFNKTVPTNFSMNLFFLRFTR